MTQLYWLLPALALHVFACGSPGRPVGLPPPEYEEPSVEPWSPPSAPASPATAPSAAEPPATAAAEDGPPPSPPENDAGSGATLPAGTP